MFTTNSSYSKQLEVLFLDLWITGHCCFPKLALKVVETSRARRLTYWLANWYALHRCLCCWNWLKRIVLWLWLWDAWAAYVLDLLGWVATGIYWKSAVVVSYSVIWKQQIICYTINYCCCAIVQRKVPAGRIHSHIGWTCISTQHGFPAASADYIFLFIFLRTKVKNFTKISVRFYLLIFIISYYFTIELFNDCKWCSSDYLSENKCMFVFV